MFVSLANEKIIVFHRHSGKLLCRKICKISLIVIADGTWDLTNFHMILTGKSRESVRCAINVGETIWFGVANRVYILDAQTLQIQVRRIFPLQSIERISSFLRNNWKFILVRNIQFNT